MTRGADPTTYPFRAQTGDRMSVAYSQRTNLDPMSGVPCANSRFADQSSQMPSVRTGTTYRTPPTSSTATSPPPLVDSRGRQLPPTFASNHPVHKATRARTPPFSAAQDFPPARSAVSPGVHGQAAPHVASDRDTEWSSGQRDYPRGGYDVRSGFGGGGSPSGATGGGGGDHPISGGTTSLYGRRTSDQVPHPRFPGGGPPFVGDDLWDPFFEQPKPLVPYLNVEFTIDDIPKWDGARDHTAKTWLAGIRHLASIGGYIPYQLGMLMPLSLSSNAAKWYSTLPPSYKDYMRSHYTKCIEVVQDLYLGDEWKREYDTQRYYQEHFRVDLSS